MDSVEKVLKLSKINKKELKKFIMEFEWEQYQENLKIFERLCKNMGVVILTIYEQIHEGSMFDSSPKINKIYIYYIDKNAVEVYLVGKNYDVSEKIDKDDFENFLFINSNMAEICQFILKKSLGVKCSNWDKFLEFH